MTVFHLPSQPIHYSEYRELRDPHRYVFTTIPCPECGQMAEITVDGPLLFRYHQGAKVQDVFPNMTAGDRERLFMSGICDSCFDKVSSDEEPES